MLLPKIWNRRNATGGLARHEYKAAWALLARTEEAALESVVGSTDESLVRASAERTCRAIEDATGIRSEDVVLEVGCGFGRLGEIIAPRCKQWIGGDVSPEMLKYARKRLRKYGNVSLVELSGFDLRPLAETSVDVVCCPALFMHLDEWDRYGYVLESYRVLRSGGRFYVDNFNLCCDAGWNRFEQYRKLAPSERPSSIPKTSTPQELEVYLSRAGFQRITLQTEGIWVRAHALKP